MGRSSIREASVISQITSIIGPEKMREICELAGGERIYLPHRLPDFERDERIQREFRELLSTGSTCMSAYGHLSAKYDLSARRIMQIANAKI